MANLYWASAINGGGTGALDAIDGADACGDSSMVPLAAGDAAIVIKGEQAYLYILKETGASESFPRIIAPDSNGGDLRWYSVQMNFNGFPPKGTAANWESSQTYGTWTVTSSSNDYISLVSGGDNWNTPGQSKIITKAGRRVYAEFKHVAPGASWYNAHLGICTTDGGNMYELDLLDIQLNGEITIGGVSTGHYIDNPCDTANQIIGIALDTATGAVWVHIDGVWSSGLDPARGARPVGYIDISGYFSFAFITSNSGHGFIINCGNNLYDYPHTYAPVGFSQVVNDING